MKLLRNEVKFALIHISELHTQSILHMHQHISLAPKGKFHCAPKKKKRCKCIAFFLVREGGVEPPRPE